MMFRSKSSTTLTPRFQTHFSNWIVVMARMFTETFQILRSKHRYVLKEWAFTFLTSLMTFTIYLSSLNIIKIMFLESVPTKTLRSRTYSFAINSIGIPPINIQSILPFLSYLSFVSLEFLFAHHLPTIIIADNIIVLDIGLYMFSGLSVHD